MLVVVTVITGVVVVVAVVSFGRRRRRRYCCALLLPFFVRPYRLFCCRQHYCKTYPTGSSTPVLPCAAPLY